MMIGLNNLCPCGSNKKYKHCCLLNPHILETSKAVDILLEYIKQCEAWKAKCDELEKEGNEELILQLQDSCHLDLSNDSYEAVCEELKRVPPWPIIYEHQDLLHEALGLKGDKDRLANLAVRISSGNLLGRPDISASSFAEFRKVLNDNDYSFIAPPDDHLPIISKRKTDRDTFKGHCVVDRHLFSVKSGKPIHPPAIIYESDNIDKFMSTVGGAHELLHVMQRVFRKNRVATYAYMKNGRVVYRNPDVYVKVSLEDELEVQLILKNADYRVSKNPILYHINSILRAFQGCPKELASDAIRKGLKLIPYEKYEQIFDGNIKDDIETAFRQ